MSDLARSLIVRAAQSCVYFLTEADKTKDARWREVARREAEKAAMRAFEIVARG